MHQCRYVNLILTTLNLGIVKISILLFYRRLFIVKPFMIVSGVMIAFVASWAIAFASAMAAQCRPPAYFWEAFEIDYVPRCLNVQVLYQALAISDIILDVLVLALPIPMVASLHLPWKTKIKVIDILMLGSVYFLTLDLQPPTTDEPGRVLGSGIARVTSFYQVVNFTNHHAQAYFENTLCKSRNMEKRFYRLGKTLTVFIRRVYGGTSVLDFCGKCCRYHRRLSTHVGPIMDYEALAKF